MPRPAGPGSTEPLVVPIVVFLTNGDRRVVQPAIDTSPTSELAVPLVTFLRGGTAWAATTPCWSGPAAAVEFAAFCPAPPGRAPTCRTTSPAGWWSSTG